MRELAIYEYGDHVSIVNDRIDPKNIKLTEAHKVYLREMAAQGLRPSRIRNSMLRKYGVDMETLPSLSKVQNFVNHYRKNMLMKHDKRKDIAEFIHKHEFSGHENDTTSFTFGWARDEYGKMFVGNGSDEKPFVGGLTTKRLLFRMDRPSHSFILHLDATFKVSQVDRSVIVCGISDRCRSFHLVALFVTSQRTEDQYLECLRALRNVYARVTGKSLIVSAVMGDADKAQFNAFKTVFGLDSNYIYLMCFYHLVAKIVERTKGMSEAAKDRVFRDIYNMHFSRKMAACVELVRTSTAEWRSDPETKDFAEYFVNQWLKGMSVGWQCFHTPGAFATANNPVEQFNKKLKRDYTLRQRLKMGTLLQQLLACCHNESSSERGFWLQVEPSSTLWRRTKELAKLKLLGEVIPPPDVLQGVSASVKFAASSRPPRVAVLPRRKTEEGIAISAQMGLNYARREVQDQPQWGWQVDLVRQTCECNMFFKFDACVHLIHILAKYGAVDYFGNETLVVRTPAKKRQRVGESSYVSLPTVPPGRPASNGHALSSE